jgi:hypothetical protein
VSDNQHLLADISGIERELVSCVIDMRDMTVWVSVNKFLWDKMRVTQFNNCPELKNEGP